MEFLAIATAHFVALLSPGPDFFLIMQAALRLPRRYGLALCAGIAAANGVYALGAVLGLEIVRDLPFVAALLRWAGGAYLLFLGIMLVRSPHRSLEIRETRSLQVQHYGKQALIGFSAAILNPTNADFYLSLFTALVATETTTTMRLFYAVWMAGIVWGWDSALVCFIGRQAVRDRLGRGVFYLERGSGVVLCLFGLFLPFT